MADDRTYRRDIGKTGQGAKPIGVMRVWDDALGENVLVDRVGTLGHPATYLSLCDDAGVSGATPLQLPFNGTGPAQGGGVGYLTMPDDHPDVDRRGLMIVIAGGTGVGHWRLVIDYDHATRRIIPNREWAVVPDATSVPLLLVPAWSRAQCRVRGEYSLDAIGEAKLRPIAWSYPETPDDKGEVGTLRTPAAPEPDVDGLEASMKNLTPLSIRPRNAGWTNAATRSFPIYGAIGLSFLVTPPTSGSFLPAGMLRVACILALVVGVARAQLAPLPDGFGEHPGFEGFSNGAAIGRCPELDVTTGLVLTPSGERCTLAATGGGASRSFLAFSSCGPIDGTVPIFLAPGGCGDQAEVNAQGRVKNAATFGNVSCFFSGTTGAQSLTGTLRAGTRGSLSGTPVTCTMGASGSPGIACESGGSTAVLAGQCVSVRASGTGLVSAEGTLTCLVEEIG